MINVSEEVELRNFLKEKNVFKTNDVRIRYFEGGVSGTVALAEENNKCVIIKQALSTLKVSEIWECDPKRIEVEKNALELYGKIIPESVPKVILYDTANYILVRDAVPENWVMWKTELMNGKINYQVAEKAIVDLYTIHNETANMNEAREMFKDDRFFYSLRIEPYILHLLGKYPELKSKVDEVLRILKGEHISLIHGDYSPKNILVNENNICILDLEVAYFGHPSFDIAFFSNHFLLKAIKNKQWSEAYLSVLDYMLNIYFSHIKCMNRTILEKQTVAVLALLLLARVDGKSPVEYLTESEDKELVRKLAFQIINEKFMYYEDVIKLFRKELKGK